jgi:hypothetical protein
MPEDSKRAVFFQALVSSFGIRSFVIHSGIRVSSFEFEAIRFNPFDSATHKAIVFA